MPNHVQTKTGEIFRFATPEETPSKMYDLINWYREQMEKENINLLLIAAEFHYKFIRIHPFDDGNGRTARILMNFILMQGGYPPVIIKTEDKENYFSALRQADAGIIEAFIYIASNLIHSLEIMIKGAQGESIEEPDDISKEIALLEQKLNSIGKPFNTIKNKKSIINLFQNSISQLAQKFYNQAKQLERFYIENEFKITLHDKNENKEDYHEYDHFIEIGNASFNDNKNLEFSIFPDKTFIDIKEICISYNYNIFRNITMNNNFQSKITIRLHKTKIIYYQYIQVTENNKVNRFEKTIITPMFRTKN